MFLRALLSIAALLIAVDAAAQGAVALQVEYVRTKNGEQFTSGTYVFTEDGNARHDRTHYSGARRTDIFTSDGARIAIDPATQTADALDPGVERAPTGGFRFRRQDVPLPSNARELLPLGPRNVGAGLTLEGYRTVFPATSMSPEREAELWGYWHAGRLHLLETRYSQTQPDGTVLVDETRIVGTQQILLDPSTFDVPEGITIRRPPVSLPSRPDVR